MPHSLRSDQLIRHGLTVLTKQGCEKISTRQPSSSGNLAATRPDRLLMLRPADFFLTLSIERSRFPASLSAGCEIDI